MLQAVRDWVARQLGLDLIEIQLEAVKLRLRVVEEDLDVLAAKKDRAKPFDEDLS